MKDHLRLCVLACSAAAAATAQVRWILPFRENAAHGDRSRLGEIVFERDGEIYQTRPELLVDACVTCGLPGGPKTCPVWHPSGAFFAFVNGGIWLWRGGKAVEIYPAKGAQDLRFSRDGKRLAWLDGAAHVADFEDGLVKAPRRLKFERTIEGVDDFSADGRELIVTSAGAIEACAIVGGRCREVVRQVGSRVNWARVSPSGGRLLYASTEGSDDKSDYRLLDAASGHAQRMTWFNEVQNPHYIDQGAKVTYASWSANGRWVLATVEEKRSRLMMIQFPEAE